MTLEDQRGAPAAFELFALRKRKEYLKYIRQYATRRERIRNGPELGLPPNRLAKIEEEMFYIYGERILKLAAFLGITRDQIYLDTVAAMGNLEDLGIKGMPVLRLPLSGSGIEVNHEGTKIILRGKNKAGLIQTPYSLEDDLFDPPKGEKVATRIRQWEQEPTYFLPYALFRVVHAQLNVPVAFTQRLERMEAAARKFELGSVWVQEYQLWQRHFKGGASIGPLQMFGLEVPAGKLIQLTETIRESPGRTTSGIYHPGSEHIEGYNI
ncbi:MAG: hypothetical protein HY344_00970 [Candidatus Levybacteria bacterium]|nr:hypothetical protein [Candidatus Levybacteria bacterium]